MLNTLSPDEVRAIHEVLAADFAAAADPISPPGVKSQHLLESAVSRQFTGYEGRVKYNTPVINAAALTYGVCCNHPFHNGNKRTSLVAMLCHLDKNDLMFSEKVSHDELYDFMLKVASHGFSPRSGGDHSDVEVEEMGRWIRKRTRKVERGERIVTFRELRGILNTHGFVLENFDNNTCDVVKYDKTGGFLGLGQRTVRVRTMRMGYPGDGTVVGKSQLREVRARCLLSEVNGVDSHAFYRRERPTDFFVSTYRGTLRRLARV
ncbi:type II toxin-antitoxin system death-on-curing family toxin [Hydrogenophaga sp.]|uniref:type II toxin-antitoxin system death-on-curing family toxin n=1 Tax=Hydrogenophaga sp. TaxID=1904254 RepID=UPI002FC84946